MQIIRTVSAQACNLLAAVARAIEFGSVRAGLDLYMSARREQQLLRRIRKHVSAQGRPLSDYSHDELTAAVQRGYGGAWAADELLRRAKEV